VGDSDGARNRFFVRGRSSRIAAWEGWGLVDVGGIVHHALNLTKTVPDTFPQRRKFLSGERVTISEVALPRQAISYRLLLSQYGEIGKDSGLARRLVLRMDKKNYKTILDTAKAQAGKPVEFLGDAKKQK
jgi:hypothetical protein